MRSNGSRRRAVGFGDQERQAERAAPGPPFGDDVAAVGGAIKRERQGRIGVLEHDGDGACRRAAGGSMRIATPR